jgi:A/G-specific adenine glycosylase
MDAPKKKKQIFRNYILEWYGLHGRDFPWRKENKPYYVMVSEVLLQKTNAEKIVSPFNRIISRYPTISELAEADESVLLEIIKDLGLFYRASRLIEISRQVVNDEPKILPKDREDLLSIKGIGNYSANAILCFGYGLRYPIVDSNVIRVLHRFFEIKSEKNRPRTDKNIWAFTERLLPKEDFVDFNYGLLDFAAKLCTHYNPSCDVCGVSRECIYYIDA